MSEIEVHKVAAFVPISEEQAADAAAMSEAWRRWMDATPEQRAEWQAQAEEHRAAERASHERRPLTLDNVLDGLGWTTEYAEHFVQDYCTCSDSYDGWDYCQHARDERVVPGGGS